MGLQVPKVFRWQATTISRWLADRSSINHYQNPENFFCLLRVRKQFQYSSTKSFENRV